MHVPGHQLYQVLLHLPPYTLVQRDVSLTSTFHLPMSSRSLFLRRYAVRYIAKAENLS